MKKIFKPFEKITNKNELILIISFLFTTIFCWLVYGSKEVHVFPTLPQVFEGIKQLWSEGLVKHLFSSLGLCVKAILLSVIISLIASYLYVIPFFKPLTNMISKFRYLPLTGISYYITILLSEGRAIQTWILVVFMTTFLTTSLIGMINNINQSEYDHARSLGCSRIQVLWEVIVKGRFDYVIEIVRQNLAIVWMFLVTVESIMVSSGGLGFLIKNSDKLGNHGRIIALQLIILIVGILLDKLLLLTRKTLFRYSKF